MTTAMQRQELAAHLGMSASLVSRYAKRGMPTDSIERAQRWIARNVRPRVKPQHLAGRPDPAAAGAPFAKRGSSATTSPEVAAIELRAIERLGEIVHDRLGSDAAPYLLAALRAELRKLPEQLSPGFTVEVWDALTGHLADHLDAPAPGDAEPSDADFDLMGAVWGAAARTEPGAVVLLSADVIASIKR